MIRVYGKKGEDFIFLFGLDSWQGLGYDLNSIEGYEVCEEMNVWWDKETGEVKSSGPYYEKLTLDWLDKVKEHIQKFMKKLEEDIVQDDNLIKCAVASPKVDVGYVNDLRYNIESNKESLEECRLSLGQLDILEIMVSDAVGFDGDPWGDFEGIYVNKGKR